jgi:hypothetical protein
MAFQKVKQFKDIELVYDSVAALTVKFYTDMPGTSGAAQGTMTLRATLTFPATTGRATYTAALDDGSTGANGTAPFNPIEGTLYKVVMTSTDVVRLFGGVVRARPIGTWFNGANGEVWTTQEQGIGI